MFLFLYAYTLHRPVTRVDTVEESEGAKQDKPKPKAKPVKKKPPTASKAAKAKAETKPKAKAAPKAAAKKPTSSSTKKDDDAPTLLATGSRRSPTRTRGNSTSGIGKY